MVCTLADFGVGMHADSHWGLTGDSGVDMLDVFLLSGGLRRLEGELAVTLRRQLVFFQQIVFHDPVEIRGTAPPVPVVHDVSALEDLSENLLEIVPRHFATAHVVLCLALQHQCAVSQIYQREGLEHVLTFGTEFPSLDHH